MPRGYCHPDGARLFSEGGASKFRKRPRPRPHDEGAKRASSSIHQEIAGRAQTTTKEDEGGIKQGHH